MAIDNGYATLADIKAWLNIPPGDTDNDTELEASIEAASREIDRTTSRHFYQVSEARTLTARDPLHVRLRPYYDLVSVSEVATDDDESGNYSTIWDASDYRLLTVDGTQSVTAGPEQQPYASIRAVGGRRFPVQRTNGPRDLVRVTGTWGWPTIPEPVRRACLIIAGELWKMKDAPFGVAGFGDFGFIRVRNNPIARRLLEGYSLPVVA